ncbi:FliM/FliN family flagellar motor switch protein [Phaeovulum sp.]|uniref:FliM/FliN family flagellar motor switch protein n=1 Tax=Phaeovulum sp. TaxID=2934796 RepID=UPI00356185D4
MIQRKVEAGRATPGAAPMTVGRALSLALAKTAQEAMELPLRVAKLEDRQLSLAELPEALAERALLAVLEGPREGLGLAAVAPSLLSVLIEMQMTGRLAPNAPPARRPTRTDAALVAGFLDKFLAQFEEMIAELPDVVWGGGFRYASYLDDPRPLGLLLEDAGFRVLQLELALGPGGMRKGELLLALPAQGRGPAPKARANVDGADAPITRGAEAAAADWEAKMERAVLQTPAELEAVLCRLRLSLATVLGLAPGAELPIPLSALEELRLEGLGGKSVGRGKLGQNRGFRAVRVLAEAEDAPTPEPPQHAPNAANEAQPAPQMAPRRRPDTARPASDSAPAAAPAIAEPMPELALSTPIGADDADPFAQVPLKIATAF